MILRLLPRSIVTDLVLTSGIALLGISLLLTLVVAMVEAGHRGLDPVGVLLMTPYIMPTMLPYTLPSCLLFACTLVFGSMSGHNEITALKAGGVHVGRVIWPAVLLGCLASGVGVWLVDQFIPSCNRRFSALLLSDVQTAVFTYLKTQQSIVEPGFPFEIYVKSVKGDKLIGPVFKKRNASGGIDMTLVAEEARMKVVPEARGEPPRLKVQFLVGTLAPHGDPHSVMYMQQYFQEMPVPNSLLRDSDHKIANLTLRGCARLSEERRTKAAMKRFDLAWNAGFGTAAGLPALHVNETKQATDAAAHMMRKARESYGEIHIRLTQALSALAFVLLGCPLAILASRREALQVFFVCFAPVTLFFYPPMIFALNVYKETVGDLSGWLGLGVIWLPLATTMFVGMRLMARVFRH